MKQTMDKHWTTEALTNDELVVEQLLRLKQSSPLRSRPASPPPLRWARRAPRSNPPVTILRQVRPPARISPSTPLAWTGGSDTSNESKRRSLKAKSASTSEKPKSKPKPKQKPKPIDTTNKESIKKQRIVIKNKETQLTKEKVRLKKDLASVRAALKEEKARRERLKKFKLLHDGKTPSEALASLSDPGNRTGGSSSIGQAVPILEKKAVPILKKKHAVGNNVVAPPSSLPRGVCFSIPDLNTVPLEYEQVLPRGIN